MQKVLKTEVLDLIEPYWAPNNTLLWNHYRDVDFPFEQISVPKPTMSVDWNLNEFFHFVHTFSATRRCMDAIGDDFFERAYRKVQAVWGEPDYRKTLEFDFVLYVGKK